MDPMTILILLLVIVGIIIFSQKTPKKREAARQKRAALEARRQELAHQQQVQAMQQWQRAYAEANNGAMPPPGSYPAHLVAPQMTSTDRTNTLAILSLVLSLIGGGVIAIVLGHIAQSQIKRTGERGSGMALAGLIIGYVSTAISIGATLFFMANV